MTLEPINVRYFGAVGDGCVDDTSTFMDAFSYAETAGSSVYIPDGNYRLTAQLKPDKIPAITGASETGTVLFWDESASGDNRGIKWTSDSDRICLRFSDMTLANKGNWSGTGLLVDTSGQVYNNSVIVQREMSRAHVERVTFRGYSNVYTDGWGINLDFNETLSTTVAKITIIGFLAPGGQEPVTSYGIRFRGNCHPSGALVHMSAISYCQVGISFQGYEGGFAEMNNIVCCNYGVEFNDSQGRPHLSARGNHINARIVGVKIVNGSEAFITDNLIYGIINATTSMQGINISGTAGELYTIRGNQFENSSRSAFPGATNAPFDGIHISASGFANIGGNIFRDVDIGTIFWPNSHNCLLDDNNLYKTVRTTKVVNQGNWNTIRTQI
jgi:hypothetical protein